MSGHEGITPLKQRLAALPSAMPRERVKLLVQLATEYARAGLPNDGLQAVREALHLIQSHRLDREQAEAMNAAALCHYFRGDYMTAIAGGLDAYQGFLRHEDFASMGHALTTIAAACKDIGASDLAIEALQGCLNIAARTGDTFLEARTRNTLGIVLGEVGRFDAAEEHLGHARRCLESIGHSTHLSKVAANVGNLFKKRAEAAQSAGDRVAAREFLQRAVSSMQVGLAAAAADDNPYETADKTGALGEYHFLLGDHATARALASEALALGRKLKHSQVMIEAHLYLGRILLAMGEHAEAERHLKLALEQARAAESRDLQLQAHRRLADCYEAMKRSRDAGAQAALANELAASLDALHRDAQREAHRLWKRYFSQHPLIAPAA